MRKVLFAVSVASAALLAPAPAHAAAATVTVDEPCPSGYRQVTWFAAGGHVFRVCVTS